MLNAIVLSDLGRFTREFERCCHEYNALHIATAWCGDPQQESGLPFCHLKAIKGTIKATVGRAFDQTHPDGIEFFRKMKADLRIVDDAARLFHPKLYLFTSSRRMALFVGSSNLTFNGFCYNVEANILIEAPVPAPKTLGIDQLRMQLDSWHSPPLSIEPSDAWLNNYRKKFIANKNAQKRSSFRTPLKYEERVPAASWLASASWGTYYQKVLEGFDQHNRDMQKMLAFLDSARRRLRLPWKRDSFDDLEFRRVVGGYGKYGWFGHVGASGDFRHILAHGNAREKRTIVEVINELGPLDALLDWGYLMGLLERLVAIGPSMKVWGRLLCLIRPDLYCTIASFSVRRNLSQVLKIPESHFPTTVGYVNLLRLLHASPWFQSPKPSAGKELAVWHKRTALMDAIFYEWAGFHASPISRQADDDAVPLKWAPCATRNSPRDCLVFMGLGSSASFAQSESSIYRRGGIVPDAGDGSRLADCFRCHGCRLASLLYQGQCAHRCLHLCRDSAARV